MSSHGIVGILGREIEEVEAKLARAEEEIETERDAAARARTERAVAIQKRSKQARILSDVMSKVATLESTSLELADAVQVALARRYVIFAHKPGPITRLPEAELRPPMVEQDTKTWAAEAENRKRAHSQRLTVSDSRIALIDKGIVQVNEHCAAVSRRHAEVSHSLADARQQIGRFEATQRQEAAALSKLQGDIRRTRQQLAMEKAAEEHAEEVLKQEERALKRTSAERDAHRAAVAALQHELDVATRRLAINRDRGDTRQGPASMRSSTSSSTKHTELAKDWARAPAELSKTSATPRRGSGPRRPHHGTAFAYGDSPAEMEASAASSQGTHPAAKRPAPKNPNAGVAIQGMQLNFGRL